MTAVVLDINLSLDGFVAAARPSSRSETMVSDFAHGPPARTRHRGRPGASALSSSRARRQDHGRAAIGQQFLAAGLVDEIVVHIVPVLLKAGPRHLSANGMEPYSL
jgi:hypothetical protein